MAAGGGDRYNADVHSPPELVGPASPAADIPGR